MSRQQFMSDLSKAQVYEKAIGKYYEKLGWQVVYAPNRYFPDYDIMLKKDDLEVRIEIKVDYMQCRTGNIAVEYCKADGVKPSGVRAGNMNDYILYLLPDSEEETFTYFITTKQKLFDNARKNMTTIVPCKDRNGYCYLLNKRFIQNIKNIELVK